MNNTSTSTKAQYINGHFCYTDKFAVLTTGQGISRHIAFLNNDFKTPHPEMLIDKKSSFPDEDKSVEHATALKPVLTDYFSFHPPFCLDTFLGDSSFDTADIYCFLKNDFHFSRALIPYNPINDSFLKKVGYNSFGYPTCPNTPDLTMKYCSIIKEKGQADRIKQVCPKMRYEKGKRVCECDNPCSAATKGRTTYTYKILISVCFPASREIPKNGISLYKIRTIVERDIDHLKINMCVAGRKIRNHTTTKADVSLTGIASQLTVIVAHNMNYPQYI